MKRVLKIMSAIILTSAATNTIVACHYNNSTKAPDLNCKYGTLLRWYQKENTISLIEQKLIYDNTAGNEQYAIVADDSLITINNLFKDNLLKKVLLPMSL